MAKGQRRSNREIRKPKKKPAVAAPATFPKGISAGAAAPKTKRGNS